MISYIIHNKKKYEIKISKGQLVEPFFNFVDRRLCFEINLLKWNCDMENKEKISFKISSLSDDIENILLIAYDSFEKDRRFALDYQMSDTELKNECLEKYIIELQEKSYQCVLCKIEQEIIGFLIFRIKENGAEIKLASMHSKYRNMGIAYYMYSYAWNVLKKLGAKRISSKVFSSNISSVNLHIKLGANAIKLKEIEDWYIKEELVDA